MATTTSPTDLDAATRLVSALPTFSALLATAPDYRPTLRADAYRGRRREACLRVRRALVEAGRRVWPEFGSYRCEA